MLYNRQYIYKEWQDTGSLFKSNFSNLDAFFFSSTEKLSPINAEIKGRHFTSGIHLFTTSISSSDKF